MGSYKVYYCYPAFSPYGIALEQIVFSNKLCVFFQKAFRGKLNCGFWFLFLVSLVVQGPSMLTAVSDTTQFFSYSINKTVMVYNSSTAI